VREKPILLGPLERASLNDWTKVQQNRFFPHLRTETDPVSETSYFLSLFFNTRTMAKVRKPNISECVGKNLELQLSQRLVTISWNVAPYSLVNVYRATRRYISQDSTLLECGSRRQWRIYAHTQNLPEETQKNHERYHSRQSNRFSN
jgi:hypothetical protein